MKCRIPSAHNNILSILDNLGDAATQPLAVDGYDVFDNDERG